MFKGGDTLEFPYRQTANMRRETTYWDEVGVLMIRWGSSPDVGTANKECLKLTPLHLKRTHDLSREYIMTTKQYQEHFD